MGSPSVARKMKHQPKPGLISVPLCCAFLSLGALFGVSFVMLTRAIAGETLPQLWGSALGAGIAATATLSAAIYNQQRTERREHRRALNEVLIPIMDCQIALGGLSNLCVMKDFGQKTEDRVSGAFVATYQRYQAIQPIPALPERINSHIRASKTWTELEFGELSNRLKIALQSTQKSDWNKAAEQCGELMTSLKNLENHIKNMIAEETSA
jgi:hypothetical protein